MNVMTLVEKKKIAELLTRERMMAHNKARARAVLENLSRSLNANHVIATSTKKNIEIG